MFIPSALPETALKSSLSQIGVAFLKRLPLLPASNLTANQDDRQQTNGKNNQ